MTTCSNPDCDNNVSDGRVKLGYTTCLECGSDVQTFTVAIAFNKGAYQLITKKNIKDIGR